MSASLFYVGDQVDMPATTLEDIHTCPAGKREDVDVRICNRNAASRTFRIAIAKNGAADSLEQYIEYDATINGNESFPITEIPLNEGDIVRGYVSAVDVSIGVYIRKVEQLAEG
jgi:hypothetical protein